MLSEVVWSHYQYLSVSLDNWHPIGGRKQSILEGVATYRVLALSWQATRQVERLWDTIDIAYIRKGAKNVDAFYKACGSCHRVLIGNLLEYLMPVIRFSIDVLEVERDLFFLISQSFLLISTLQWLYR